MSNLIHNLSNADYHAHPAVSSSQLKHMLRTPAHFKASLETSKEPSDAMKLGSLVHTLLLEPHLVDYEYTVMPKFDRRTKQGKARQTTKLGLSVTPIKASSQQIRWMQRPL